MRRLNVRVWTALLFGVLALSAVLLKYGEQEQTAFPSITSTKPSGLAAFAEILRRTGFQVSRTRSADPSLGSSALAIIPTTDETDLEFDPQEGEDGMGLAQRVREDGTPFVAVRIPSDFKRELAGNGAVRTTNSLDGTALETTSVPLDYFEFRTDWITVWEALGSVVMADGKGGFVVNGGLIATNALIDQQDNAELLYRTVLAAADGRKEVVFCEALIAGPEETDLIDTFGSWALPAWWQGWLLVAVVVFTLGKRFGLPSEARQRERGARDLVDAIAGTFLRARATGVALESAAVRADASIRKAQRISRDASRETRDSRLPESLRLALAAVEGNIHSRLSHRDALTLVRRLEDEVAEFVGSKTLLR